MIPYHVHLTDIFHPHGDPDDHFDLALAFALHAAGYTELGRVVIDYPPAHRVGDPALCAVAQLNEITGSDVRACVAPKDAEAAGRFILSVLREAPRPVTFTVVGTTESIAAAIRMEPELFREKCAGIYLAAGTGKETEGGPLEYNVNLHAASYATMFTAPCPLYWAPCFQTILPGGYQCGGEYGSVFALQHKELLESLSPRMQQYFLYMLSRSADPKYLRYLDTPVDADLLKEQGEVQRRLWSAPLLLHLAGIPCESYEFVPVHAVCAPDGHLTWEPAEESLQTIFRMKQNDRETENSFDMTGSYKEEMLAKLKEFLGKLA